MRFHAPPTRGNAQRDQSCSSEAAPTAAPRHLLWACLTACRTDKKRDSCSVVAFSFQGSRGPRTPPAARTRPASAAQGGESKALPAVDSQQRQQQKCLHQRQQELVVARRQRQQQVADAHNEWRWWERMHRLKLQQQQRQLESDLRQMLQIHPSSRLPASLEGRLQQSFGGPFCPNRLASLYNLSIRYWDEGCASLATRTLQGALQMLQHHGLSGGCVAHTWEAMELLGGSRQLRLVGPTAAATSCNTASKRKLDNKDRYFRSRLLFARRMFVAAGRQQGGGSKSSDTPWSLYQQPYVLQLQDHGAVSTQCLRRKRT